MGMQTRGTSPVKTLVDREKTFATIKRMFLEKAHEGSELIRCVDGRVMYKVADGEHEIYAHWNQGTDLLNSWNYNYSYFTNAEFIEFEKSQAYKVAMKLLLS